MDTCTAHERNITMRAGSAPVKRLNSALIFLLVTEVMIVALPSAATVPGPPCQSLKQNEEVLSQLLEDGNTAFEAGDLTKAETCWTQIRECALTTPHWPKAVFNLGLLQYRRRNFRQAIAYFDEVLQSQPDDKEPGGSLMETNRNYTHRSALAISECYEAIGAYSSALHYARLAKSNYRYYSWCGTCYSNANIALDKRIAYLTVRALRVHVWAAMLVAGLVVFRWRKKKAQASSLPTDDKFV